jgi:hypothetical protein
LSPHTLTLENKKMAGIAEIIAKRSKLSEKDLKSSFASMMQKSSFSDSQLSTTFINENVCFGNILHVSANANNHYQHNISLKIYSLVGHDYFNRSGCRYPCTNSSKIPYNMKNLQTKFIHALETIRLFENFGFSHKILGKIKNGNFLFT